MSRACQIRAAIDRARARGSQFESAIATAADERRRYNAQLYRNEAHRNLQWLLGELDRLRHVEGLNL